MRSTLEYDGGKVRFELVDNFRANERKPLMLTLAGSCFAKKNTLGRLKVSSFHNEFMRSSFVPKFQPKITEISSLEVYYFKVNTKREFMYVLFARKQ